MNRQTILLSAALMTLVFSCKKSLGPAGDSGDTRLATVVRQLRDSMTAADFASVDTTAGYLTRAAGGGDFLRLGFRGMPLTKGFVLVRMDSTGRVLAGRFVDLYGMDTVATGLGGSIVMKRLDGSGLWSSKLQDGYVLALHPELMTGMTTMGTNEKNKFATEPGTLPEAEVIGYYLSGQDDEGGSPAGLYVDLAALLDGDGDGSGGSYSSVGGEGSGGGSGGIRTSSTVQFETEYDGGLPIVDLKSVFNCFGHVPDDGAQYNLELCADVPSNNDPDASATFSPTVSAGHSFLVATKTNNGVSVTQCIGFYPQQTPSMFGATDALPSAIKDNGGHEINAVISRSLTAAQFQAFETAAINDANNNYDLITYNCTDFALGVWNGTGAANLTVAPMEFTFPVPDASVTADLIVNSSPQGLFNTLQSMQAGGASGITLDLSGNFKAPGSSGQCPN